MSLEKWVDKYGCLIFCVLWVLVFLWFVNAGTKIAEKKQRRKEMCQKINQIWENQQEGQNEYNNISGDDDNFRIGFYSKYQL